MKKYLPYILYFFIALAIMRPFFGAGQLFLLDMVYGQNIRLSDYLSNGLGSSFPLMALLKFFNLFLAIGLLQKLLLLFLFWLAGSAMYALARSQKMTQSLAFASGLFFMLNPYVYERFLAGHWLVFFGYAIFPLVLKFFIELLQTRNRKSFGKFALVFGIYPIISLHWFYIAFFFLIFTGLVYLWRAEELGLLTRPQFLKYLGLFFVIFALLNTFWLSTFFNETGVIQNITKNDFQAYKTEADSRFGAFFNVLSLYGFWNVANFIPKDFFDLWWLIAVLVLVFFLLGVGQSLKEKKPLALVVAILFIPVLLLAVGYATPFSKAIINFLYEYLPGFRGLRETGKITGLLAFSYALYFPLGIDLLLKSVFGELYKKFVQLGSLLTVAFACLIPLLISFGIFNSFSNQVKAYDYPIGWSQVKTLLEQDFRTGKVLFLPWHGYPRLDFAGHTIVANPAQAFFGQRIIAGKNLDTVILPETVQKDWDYLLVGLVQGLSAFDDNLAFLKSRGVDFVILAKIDDYARYGFLSEAQSLKKVFEDENIVLYIVGTRLGAFSDKTKHHIL